MMGSVLPDKLLSIPYLNLSSGPHTVALTGVAPNCAVSGEHPRAINVVDGAGTVHLDVVCHVAITLGVHIETSGDDPDPDGYVARLNGVPGLGILAVRAPPGGWFLPPGDYTVTLSDIAPHCRLSGSNTVRQRSRAGHYRCQLHGELRGNENGRFGRDLLVDANTEINLLSADGSRFVNLTNHPDLEVSRHGHRMAERSPLSRATKSSTFPAHGAAASTGVARLHDESRWQWANPAHRRLPGGGTRLVAGRRQACLHQQPSRRYFARLRHECRREWADPAGEPWRGRPLRVLATSLVPGRDQDRLFGLAAGPPGDLRDQCGWQRGDATDRRVRHRCGLVSGWNQDRVRAGTSGPATMSM